MCVCERAWEKREKRLLSRKKNLSRTKNNFFSNQSSFCFVMINTLIRFDVQANHTSFFLLSFLQFVCPLGCSLGFWFDLIIRRHCRRRRLIPKTKCVFAPHSQHIERKKKRIEKEFNDINGVWYKKIFRLFSLDWKIKIEKKTDFSKFQSRIRTENLNKKNRKQIQHFEFYQHFGYSAASTPRYFFCQRQAACTNR